MASLEEEIRDIRARIAKLEVLLEEKLEAQRNLEDKNSISLSVADLKKELMENSNFNELSVGVITNVVFFDERIKTIKDMKKKMENTNRKFHLEIIVKGVINNEEYLYYSFEHPFDFKSICDDGRLLEKNLKVALKYDHFQEEYYTQLEIVNPDIVRFSIRNKDLSDYRVIQEGGNEPIKAIINKRK